MCVLSRSVMSDFATPWAAAHQAPLSMGILQGTNTRVGCHAFLQGIFPTEGSNPGLPHCRWMLYCLSYQGRTKARKEFVKRKYSSINSYTKVENIWSWVTGRLMGTQRIYRSEKISEILLDNSRMRKEEREY